MSDAITILFEIFEEVGILAELEARGEARGEAKGLAEGKAEGKAEERQIWQNVVADKDAEIARLRKQLEV